MRFSLRTLLLLFALVAIACSLSYFYARSQVLGWRELEQPGFEDFRRVAEYVEAKHPHPLDVSRLNGIFQGLSSFPFAQLEFEWCLFLLRRDRDPWGKAYHWVALDQNNQPLPHVPSADKAGIYSTGPDGTSSSYGNDPDNINSWNTTEAEFITLMERGTTHQIRRRTLQTMPGMLMILLAGVLIYQNRPHLRPKRVPFFTRDERPWAER